jgi:circadian clock protein KaiC
MNSYSIEKLPTGIPGFDHIAYGGLPKGRSTLIAGTSGSAKTVFACQFLVEGIRQHGESGVFVTFEESPDDIRSNMLGLGWDIAQWEREGKWNFLDASRQPGDEYVVGGQFDLTALLARVENSVRTSNAQRVSLDSVGALLGQFNDPALVRNELLRIVASLKAMQVTSVMTAERINDRVGLARFGVEEFAADNVVTLRNNQEDERRRRTIEILKFRGAMHAKGEFPFTVASGKGIVVIPLSALELTQPAPNSRLTSGNAELDEMCGGGLFRDSIILVAGATGTGKTLIANTIVYGGVTNGERCLYFAFEESRDQLSRNSIGWGIDLEKLESGGLLRLECVYPESNGLQDHLIRLQAIVHEFRPQRVVVDSLSALNRVATPKGLREFLIGLTAFLKHEEITALFTTTTSALFGMASVTEDQISTLTDTIILLRYLETEAEMRRGLMVLKMRGSQHDKRIRELKIDNKGIQIGDAFHSMSGILSGNMSYMTTGESALVRDMFSVGPDS